VSVVLNNLPDGNWTINPGAITGTGASIMITGLTNATYKFTVTDASGCTSVASSDVVIFPVQGAPSAPILVTLRQPTCATATGSIALNGLPETGTWTINPGAISGSSSSIIISELAAGTYNYTVSNADGCTSLASTDIVINSQPTIPPAPASEVSYDNGFNISCSGSSDGFIRINPSGETAPYIFNWSGPGGFTSTSKDISGLKAGQYILSVTDVNECIITETFDLTEPPQMGMTVTRSVSSDGVYNINCADAQTGYVSISATNYIGSANYLWSDGYAGSDRSNLTAGSYEIIITDSNNCRADSIITLTAPDRISISFDVIKPFCPDKPNGEITSTVAGGIAGSDYSYLWSANSTGKNLSNILEGKYTLIVTDLNGCSVKDSVGVKAVNETCLIIPNAFSPNGDLINDVWNIGNIDLYPLIQVTVINSWGQTVWRSERGYPKPWDGRSNGIMLPIDSYFYIINLHNGSKPIAGSVTIIK
jgi:gliding motility-associated-like protein